MKHLTSTAEIRALSELSLLAPLLLESEAQGFRLLRRLKDDFATGANRFEKPGELLLGAFHGERLVGVGGLNLDPFAGDPRVGRIRRVYVLTEFRGRGIGRKLMTELMAGARRTFSKLRLRTREAPARKLYESLGFVYLGEGETTHELHFR
jgi:ribosomal protein S18 acetylase RimI-like enzyme